MNLFFNYKLFSQKKKIMSQLQLSINIILSLLRDQYSNYFFGFIYLVTKWVSIYFGS